MKRNKKITTILFIGGIAVAVIILLNSLRGEVTRGNELDKEIKRLEEEAAKLENRNSALLDLTKEISDSEFLESEARLKMGMKLPGEQVVVINRDAQGAAPGRPIVDENGSIWENPKKWYQYFFEVKK